MQQLLYKEEVYAIVGAAMEVYNVLGPGFLEAVYQEALEVELADRRIPFRPQPELPVYYKGRQLRKYFVGDLLAFDSILIEIKAIDSLSSREFSQLINQLKAGGIRLGLLINFGAAKNLQWKRIVFSDGKHNTTTNK